MDFNPNKTLIKMIKQVNSGINEKWYENPQKEKSFFLMTCQMNVSKWAISGLIGKKSCKKQKKNI